MSSAGTFAGVPSDEIEARMRRRAIGQVTKSRRECVVAQYRLAASQLNRIEKSSVGTLEGVPSDKVEARKRRRAIRLGRGREEQRQPLSCP